MSLHHDMTCTVKMLNGSPSCPTRFLYHSMTRSLSMLVLFLGYQSKARDRLTCTLSGLFPTRAAQMHQQVLQQKISHSNQYCFRGHYKLNHHDTTNKQCPGRVFGVAVHTFTSDMMRREGYRSTTMLLGLTQAAATVNYLFATT